MFFNYIAYSRGLPGHFFCRYIPPTHRCHGCLQKISIVQAVCCNFKKKKKNQTDLPLIFACCLWLLLSLRSAQVCSPSCTLSNCLCCFFDIWQDADCNERHNFMFASLPTCVCCLFLDTNSFHTVTFFHKQCFERA